MANPMTATVSDLSINDINRVYSGKAGRCCCGCSGKYSSDDKAKRRLLRLLNENPSAIDRGSNYIAVELGTRIHIAYFDC